MRAVVVVCRWAVADDARAIQVTTSKLTSTHVARNTFVIEGYSKEKDGKDLPEPGTVLQLGQPFRLRLNPVLFGDQQVSSPCARLACSMTDCAVLCASAQLYLHSQPVSVLSASKVSRKQEVRTPRSLVQLLLRCGAGSRGIWIDVCARAQVVFCTSKSYDTVWWGFLLPGFSCLPLMSLPAHRGLFDHAGRLRARTPRSALRWRANPSWCSCLLDTLVRFPGFIVLRIDVLLAGQCGAAADPRADAAGALVGSQESLVRKDRICLRLS